MQSRSLRRSISDGSITPVSRPSRRKHGERRLRRFWDLATRDAESKSVYIVSRTERVRVRLPCYEGTIVRDSLFNRTSL